MNAPQHCEAENSPTHASPDFNAATASLRSAGAHRFDPVRLHYLEVLTQRTREQQPSVRRLLEGKLAQELAAFQQRFEDAQSVSKDTITAMALQYPEAAQELQLLFASGDFLGVSRAANTLKTSAAGTSLGELVRHIAQHSPENTTQHPLKNADSSSHAHDRPRRELKTLRHFRNTWSKLSVDKQVAQALNQAPKNAGPINSHMLVLRSLSLMRDISPDYLNRFMSYADTLLCLDQDAKRVLSAPKKSTDGAGNKKSKGAGSRAR